MKSSLKFRYMVFELDESEILIIMNTNLAQDEECKLIVRSRVLCQIYDCFEQKLISICASLLCCFFSSRIFIISIANSYTIIAILSKCSDINEQSSTEIIF